MAEAYVIRNQLGQYLTKKGEWASGKEPSLIFHQPHHDQALNQLIEVNSKDIELRGRVESLELNEKRIPVVVELGPDPVQPELLPEGPGESGAEGSSPAEGSTPAEGSSPAEGSTPAKGSSTTEGAKQDEQAA